MVEMVPGITKVPSYEVSITDAYPYGAGKAIDDGLSWVRAQIQSYSYKPSFAMTAVRSTGVVWLGDSGVAVRMIMLVPDSRRPNPVQIEDDEYGLLHPSDFLDRPIRYGRYGRRMVLRNIAPVQGVFPVPSTVINEERDFERWLFRTITGFEDHEIREWFRRDGKLVDDPHNPTGRLR